MNVDGIILLDETNDMVAKSIAAGSWEPYSRIHWINTVKSLPENATVWDVGAYTGIYSLLAAKHGVNLNVIAFEPHPTIYKNLCDNIKENNVKILANNCALSEYNGQATLNITNNIKMPSGSSLIDIGKKIQATHQVDVFTGDHYANAYNFKLPNLVKIDVEGAEMQVLRGMKDVLFQSKPTILIEILSENTLRDVSEFLHTYGYKISRINEKDGTYEPPFSDSDRNYICYC